MEDALAATAHHLFSPIVIGDDGCTFCCSIAYAIVETYFMQEFFYLSVQGRSADDEFVEVSSKGLSQAVANTFLYAVSYDGHLHEHPHLRVLYARHDCFAHDFLDDEGHDDEDDGLHFGKGAHQDCWRSGFRKEVDVRAYHELVGELECHAVHMRHWKHREHVVACLNDVAKFVLCEVAVAPECAVRQHDALRVACRSACVVQHCHLVGAVFVVAQKLGQEAARELLSEESVQVLASISQLVVAAHEEAIIDKGDDAFEVGHLVGIERGPNLVADKEEFRLRVIDDVVNLVWMELVKHRHSNGAISQYREEGSSPSREIPAAKRNLVARLDAGFFKEDMELLDDTRHILILQGENPVIRHRIQEPMLLNRL